jgi:hypothetical protein
VEGQIAVCGQDQRDKDGDGQQRQDDPAGDPAFEAPRPTGGRFADLGVDNLVHRLQ